MSRLLSSRQTTTNNALVRPRLSDLNQLASAKPGALQHREQAWLERCAKCLAELQPLLRPRVAVVIDLFSRQVVGWSLRENMTRDIVMDALRMAWFRRRLSKKSGLTFHSDRGSQNASQDFRDLLKEYDITSSMSRRAMGRTKPQREMG
jgi:transposase InsO family protein